MLFGEIYKEVAKEYVKSMAGGPELVEQWLVAGFSINAIDYRHIEAIVRLEDVILAGVSALRNGLDYELRQYLPLGYDGYVLHGKKCDPLKLDFRGIERQQAILTVILRVMEAMHDAWVKEHLPDLEDAQAFQKTMNKQLKRMFVPLPLLGWKLARRYYEMARLLLKGCKLLPEESTVKHRYELQVKKFCQQNEIYDEATLQNALMRGSKFYFALSGKAEELFVRKQSVQKVARAIVKLI